MGRSPLGPTHQVPYIATTECPEANSTTDEFGHGFCKNTGHGPGTRITVRFSNGRVFEFTYSNSASSIWGVNAADALVGWVAEYIRLNITPLPRVPIGAWWNTSGLPTAWNGHGQVTFVYSQGWVFVYPPGSGVGSAAPTRPGDNEAPPTEDDVRYAQQVMRGEIKPPGVT